MTEDEYHAATGPVWWLPTWSFVDPKPVELRESYITGVSYTSIVSPKPHCLIAKIKLEKSVHSEAQ